MLNFPRHRLSIGIWLTFLLVFAVIIARSHFTADMSAFLPRTPTAQQQVLVDQLREGLASKLILIGIEGAGPAERASISKQMAQQLRANPAFVSINNGEDIYSKNDREFLFKHRYLLSPAVTEERFSVAGLRAAIGDSLDQLASPAGLLVKSLLPHDPTGEMMQLIERLNSDSLPSIIDGAWSSHDGNTALILAQTRASGSDTDAQQQAIQAIQAVFDQAAGANDRANASKVELLMTGPGVFSVIARDTIKSQVRLIFIISTLLIAGLLLLVYRSFSALLLGFLPVATGIMAGIAAVSLGFGVVHGVTLGFGTALIGEAIDYSVYLFMQSDNQPEQQQSWIEQVWPTVRLGVLTSIFGFASLLLSGFPGLAQLGLYAIVGLAAAAIMTRYVLPHLLPTDFHIRDVSAIGVKLSLIAQRAGSLRWGAVLLLVIAIVILFGHRNNLWNHELAALSPVPAEDIALDTRLRAGMGAPDVRYLIVVSGDSQESVLNAAEKVSQELQPLVEEGVLAGFESPSFYLPSIASQKARQESLPAPEVLHSRLQQASADLPLKSRLLDPFLADVEAARQQPLLQRADLDNTSMAMAMDAMLVQQGERWTSLLPLTAPVNGNIDTAKLQAAIKQAQLANVLFIDLKAESDQMYAGYLDEAIMLSLAGLVAIILLLLLVLRSMTRVAAVIAPLAASVLLVTAGLALAGQQLIILHLVGLLLVVAIGSNYALFFDQRDPEQTIAPRTFASLLVANVATVLGFGLLAFSSVPVLQALGITVAPGVIIALVLSAVFSRRQVVGNPVS